MLTERDLRKQRRWPQVLVVALLFPAPMASGVMEGFHEFVLDFTKPAEAKKKAKWSPADKLGPDAKGLGWDGPQNASYDVWIETTEPVAVGWSWRTTRSVGIHAEVEPPGKFQFRGSTTVFPSGEVYARYSPDAKHWSSWQSLGAQMPRDKKNPKQTFRGTISVPYRQRRAYTDRLLQYSRQDVPWKSDEEAAVRWILKSDPGFLKEQMPFIGYVQFLYETSLRGGQRLRRLKFSLNYGVGGMHSLPRDKGAYKARLGIPWRFKAERVEEGKGKEPE